MNTFENLEDQKAATNQPVSVKLWRKKNNEYI